MDASFEGDTGHRVPVEPDVRPWGTSDPLDERRRELFQLAAPVFRAHGYRGTTIKALSSQKPAVPPPAQAGPTAPAPGGTDLLTLLQQLLGLTPSAPSPH